MNQRPTAMREAFGDALTYPETDRAGVKRVVKALLSKRGYVLLRPKTLKSDGPRPKGVPLAKEMQ